MDKEKKLKLIQDYINYIENSEEYKQLVLDLTMDYLDTGIIPSPEVIQKKAKERLNYIVQKNEPKAVGEGHRGA